MTPALYVVDLSSPEGHRELVQSVGGSVNYGFSERSTNEFYTPTYGPWRLFIDDELLQTSLVRGSEGWIWKPGFYAGTVRVDLVATDGAIGCAYLLDVAPHAGKLGQLSFQRLISEILADDPSLILGDEPATHALGHSDPIDNLSVQYAYLFQHSADLLAALKSIEKRPRRALKATRITVPLSRIRRADGHTALVMARNGSLAALTAAVSTDLTTEERIDWRFDVPFSVESLDCSATRCIAAFANAVLRRAIQLGVRLEQLAASEADSETRTAFRTRWPRRREFLEGLVHNLERTLRREPFRSVRRPEVTAAGLTAVAADPIYARAQRLAWKILRPGTTGSNTDSWAWMSPTWELYETWCFVRLRHVLRHIFPELTWQSIRVPFASACFEGKSAQIQARLYWQPVFRCPRKGQMQNEFSSISKELRPDFVITIDELDVRRWLVLDAKYSQGRQAVLDAMYSAHVYHDALRRFHETSFRSFLLLPALGDDVGWLHERAFKDAHGVGLITCSPEREYRNVIVDELREVATAALNG